MHFNRGKMMRKLMINKGIDENDVTTRDARDWNRELYDMMAILILNENHCR
jgi:hypothetical protein